MSAARPSGEKQNFRPAVSRDNRTFAGMKKGLMNRKAVPPQAAEKPVKLEKFGDVRVDPYYWLREKENPEVLAHLKAENAYFDRVTEPLRKFEDKLYHELKNRFKDRDESVPVLYKGYLYQIIYPAGKEYPVFVRSPEKFPHKKEIYFDANQRAEGKKYYHTELLKPDPSQNLLAFAEDFTGDLMYEIRFKNLKTGKLYPEVLRRTSGSGAWARDGKTFFYIRKHPVHHRHYRLYKHILGTPQEEDILIYEETDPEFGLDVNMSKTEDFIYLTASSNTTTEYRYISASAPDDAFRIMQPRKKGVEYYPYHLGKNEFLVTTNEKGASNFKILHARLENGKWIPGNEFLAHRKDVLLEELEVFDNWIALTERQNGLTRLRIMSLDKTTDYYLPFSEETYTIYIGQNPDPRSRKLRFVYNSLTTPPSVMEHDIDTRKTVILKEEEIADGKFDKENYRSLRLWAPGRDGTRIPVSLVWHKNIDLFADNPLLLYGYGAYGITVDDNFSRNRLSLLDRGFVFAIAHVRGGEYLGRQWYEDGKLLKKKNTFYDFIDVARHLIRQGITSPEKLFAMGGSAGGLLTGAAINMEPRLFKGIVAQVPFVDVLTTMLDENLPLTTGEYEEWGNPREKTYYDYIKSYSPYDNVAPRAYPDILITAGINDAQVPYWEPAKWAAKLRQNNTADSLILLRTDLNTGHAGASGRYAYLKDVAREFAFLLDLAGKIDADENV